ncbi:MAG: phosphodiester glycosidase family protein, partial [Syntrophomonadaceae bacterium]|nr:phosphodiester glycosidase family protein [Syntrophomonadaceae bacterium]
ENPVIEFTDEQAYNANFIILKKVKGSKDGGVKLGQEYEAEVVSIIDTFIEGKSITLPKDSMVLASQGEKATWVKEHLQVGDKVRFSFNLKDRLGRKLDLEQAICAYLPLVLNGKALTKENMLEICKNDWDRGIATINATDKARTAIGYTKDNKIIALVFDGGGATSESYGIDLPSMAKRLEELGVVAAVSLDGGGSTQMNTRLFGETEVKVINKPSDGKERIVSNTILFASNAPKANNLKELKVLKDINIYQNTTYAFQARGQDSNGHPVDLSKADIKWKVNSYNSSIDDKGVFKAGHKKEKVVVEAFIGSVKATAQVNVVDEVPILDFTDKGILALALNVPKQLHIKAYTEDKEPIIITNEAAKWRVEPSSIATIDENGVLTPLKKGEGKVTAKVGEKEVTLEFVSGLENQLIDGYEVFDTNSYFIDGYIGGKAEISTEVVKEGNYSLKVDYDYANWDKVYNGTINIRMSPDVDAPSYTTHIRPKKLGMWVYGDGKAPWLRAVLKDGNQNSHVVNLASRIDWIGWKYVSVDIPHDIPMPITLNYFYMVETDKSRNYVGTVYFDDIRFIYNE